MFKKLFNDFFFRFSISGFYGFQQLNAANIQITFVHLIKQSALIELLNKEIKTGKTSKEINCKKVKTYIYSN
jgi:hypothetical protein